MIRRIRFWLSKKPFFAFTDENGSRVGWAFEKYHFLDDSVTIRMSYRAYFSHRSRMSRETYLAKVVS